MKWQLISIIISLLLLVCSCQSKAETAKPIPKSTSELDKVNGASESDIVSFPDKNLEAAIRNALFIEGIRSKDKVLSDKPLDEPITESDLAKLTIMEAVGANIISIAGLEYCVNIKELYLPENQITDIRNISSLTNLTKLDLGANQIGDISHIASLTNLTQLDLYVNQIEDISSIASLKAITNLYLFRNQISDISPLANLNNLIEVDLYRNKISDISPLLENEGLGEGDILRLAGNNLDLSEDSRDMEDIEALQGKGVVVVLE